jgi:hypothetical protein
MYKKKKKKYHDMQKHKEAPFIQPFPFPTLSDTLSSCEAYAMMPKVEGEKAHIRSRGINSTTVLPAAVAMSAMGAMFSTVASSASSSLPRAAHTAPPSSLDPMRSRSPMALRREASLTVARMLRACSIVECSKGYLSTTQHPRHTHAGGAEKASVVRDGQTLRCLGRVARRAHERGAQRSMDKFTFLFLQQGGRIVEVYPTASSTHMNNMSAS